MVEAVLFQPGARRGVSRGLSLLQRHAFSASGGQRLPSILPVTRNLFSSSSKASPQSQLNGLNGAQPDVLCNDDSTHDSTASTPTTPVQKDKIEHQHPQQRKRYAVLVDAENAQLDSMELVLREIRDTFDGDASVRRVYADFSHQSAHGMLHWKNFCLAQSFLPVHAFSYVQGKGSSDAALMIDAMELLFTNLRLDGFCIVSSDSDFTRLAQRLRESGKHVVGFGQAHTPEPFVTACESFVYVNVLKKQEEDRLRQEAFARAKKKRLREAKQTRLQEEEQARLEERKRQELEEKMSKEKAEQGFFERWFSYFTATSAPQEGKGDIDPQRESSDKQNRKTPVPGENLDRLHKICKKHSNGQGFCQLSFLAQKGEVDFESYGYQKFSDLIADYPEEFELKVAKDRCTVLVKSLKNT